MLQILRIQGASWTPTHTHTHAHAAREWPSYVDPISLVATGITMLVDKSNHVIPQFHIHPHPPPPYASQ